MADRERLSPQDYRRLRDFRSGIRRFLRWSEEQAASAGLTSLQHQLLLSVRAHEDPRGPTIGELAHALLLRHHTVVGLADRTADKGLVRRVQDPEDHRVVRLRLTPLGARRLARLSAMHLEELGRTGPGLAGLWRGLPLADDI